MFGLSLAELLVIMVVVIIFVGPDKLPELAKKAGKYSLDFRKNYDKIRREVYNGLFPPANEIKDELKKLSSEIKAEIKNDR